MILEVKMYCSNCGKQLADGANYCAFCGTKVASPTLNFADGQTKPDEKIDTPASNTSQPYQNPYFNQPQNPNSNVNYQPQANQYYTPQPSDYRPYTPAPQTKTNTLSVVGFCLSIGSFVLFQTVIISIGLAIAGLILGIIGIRQHKATPTLKGKGLAIAAIAVSSACLAIWTFIFAILFLVLIIEGSMLYY